MTDSAAPLLTVEGLVAGYEPGLPIVRNTSLAVKPREIVALLGPNGAGKSTLLKAVAGLVPIAAGSVRLDGQDLTHSPAHRRVFQGMALVPQTENIFTSLSVHENLQLAGHCLRARVLSQQLAAMYQLFPDLNTRRSATAGLLSGGQRQMLALARALLINPRLLLLDEPSAGLSPKLVGQVFAKLGEIRDQGVTLLLVEQNARAALRLADRGLILVDGRPRLSGSAAELLADPQVGALYLGS